MKIVTYALLRDYVFPLLSKFGEEGDRGGGEATMLVKDAKEIARRWIAEEATNLPGFSGAFFHGSINDLPDNATLSASSDLDIMVALSDPPATKLGKFVYQGVLLEASYIALNALQSPEEILAISHMAGSFRSPSIIADPTGQLTKLQAVVARDFAKAHWVRARCEDVQSKILRNLNALKADDPLHDQVTSWLFATGLTTHMLLVAGLKNPTVRKRYLAARELLEAYHFLGFYDPLLDLLGCVQITEERVNNHLATMTAAFDAATAVVKTPFFFASDISDIGRVISIDGTSEMIEQGNHREAIFWIVATYARCQKILFHDASTEVYERYAVGFWELVAALGINSFADLQHRSEQIQTFLPSLCEVTEEILAANSEIEE